MTLITTDELARGLALVVFGSAAGGVALAVPGSPLWLLPAALGLGASAFTVPEVRDELQRAMPGLLAAPAQARALLGDVRQRGPRALLGAAPAQDGTATAQPAGTPAARQRPAQGAPAAGAALPPRQWLYAVNERPDDNPHLTVVGPSGTGKTTFVSAALGKRPGRVVVLTPKVSPSAWRGAEVVTLDNELSYDPIAAALDALQTEAKTRAKMLQRGEPLEPMTVVLDELPELHAEVPGLGKFAVRLSRWGRELNMRQVVIATSDDALNIPGWAATRPNYARVELGKPLPDGRRPAWLDDGQSRRALDLGSVKAGAEQAQLQPWRGAQPSTATTQLVRRAEQPAQVAARSASADVSIMALDALAAMLAEPVTSASQRPVTADGVTVTTHDQQVTVTGHGSVTTATGATVTPGPGGLTINLNASASAAPAEAAPAAGGRRRHRPGRGLSAAERRARAEQQRQQQRQAELAQAYADRKAAGLSYRKAYGELGGNRTETQNMWHAAPAPVTAQP